MAPLATAFVRLRTDSTLLAAEAVRDAEKAGTAAGAAMGTRMTTGLSRTFKAAAGIGAATGLVEIGKKVFELADSFEGARARVETNAKNVGVAFGSIAKPLDDLDSHMAAFGFTVTDTENSFAAMVTATRDPVKAMQDVALAADIARGRNQSLAETTSILQRVETGHVSQLGRLGIALKDASGNTLTAADAMRKLNELYGGNAQQFAGSMAGKQAVLSAEFQKSATEISVALLPALVDLAGVVQHDVVPPVVDAAHWFERNKNTIEPLVKAVVLAGGAWKLYAAGARAAAAANVLFGGSLAGTIVASRAVTAGASVAVGAAATSAAGAAMSPGAAIGTGMAANLNNAQTEMASNALNAASNIRTMGLAALGFANLINNPRSLGFPMGFNNDLGVGQPHKGQHITLPDGRTATVLGVQRVFTDKQGREYSDVGLKHLITDTKAVAAAMGSVSAVTKRTADQIISAAQATIALRTSQDDLRSAMHGAAQTAADDGRTLMGNSDAALANRDAVARQADAMFSVITAMKAHHASASAQSAMLQTLTNAIELNAVKLYGDKRAVDELLRSLGLIPGAVTDAAAAIEHLPALRDAVNSDRITKGVTTQLQQALGDQKKTGEKVAKSFSDGYTPIVSKATTDAAGKASAAFNKFKDTMTSDLRTIRDAISSTQSTIAGFAAFSTSGTDALGASGANSDFIGQKRAAAQKLEQFAHLYGQLARSGLNPDDLHEFVGLGPAAIPAMQAMVAAGRAGIRTENALDRRILRVSGQVATLDVASQNAGLIHKDLAGLPGKIGQEFRKGLRDLHINLSAKEIDYKNGVAVVISP